MALIFQRYGLVAALAFCVITDFAAAFAMREMSMKAGMETIVSCVNGFGMGELSV